MIGQLKTIREALTFYSVLDADAKEALTALTQLEAMVGEQEPVAKLHDDGYWTPMKTDAGRALNEHLMRAGSPSIEVYTAAPVAQQTVTNDEQASAYLEARLWEFIDMAGMWPKAKPDPRTWAHVMVYAPPAQQPQKLEDSEQYRMQMAGISTAAIGYWKEGEPIHPDYDTVALRDVAKLYAKYDALYKTQQPQSRPDFTDEWTGYLKDGETPFERFLRERKDLDALTKLYQRALEENERLKVQQPQAEAVHRYVLELPDGDKREVKIYWIERQETAGEITHRLCIAVDAAPQQAEAVPSDVVRDAERYRWLRNESWAGYNTGKGTPSVYTVDGAGNRRMMLAEEAMDDAIDAAIAAIKQGGGV